MSDDNFGIDCQELEKDLTQLCEKNGFQGVIVIFSKPHKDNTFLVESKTCILKIQPITALSLLNQIGTGLENALGSYFSESESAYEEIYEEIKENLSKTVH